MKRFMALTIMGIAGFVALSVFAIPRSEALGSESLGCFVNSGVPGVYTSECLAANPQPSYDVVFQVLGESGSYTFSWSVGGGTIVAGCTSTSDSCIIHVLSNRLQIIPVSVTLSQGGQQRTVSATAEIEPVCGNDFC